MKNKKIVISIIILILGIIGYFGYQYLIEKSEAQILKIENQKIENNSKDFIKENFGDMSEKVKNKIVVMGKNPDAKNVFIYSQGGPTTQLDATEGFSIIYEQAQINIKTDALLVNVHQYQTFPENSKKTKEKAFSFEQAKIFNKESTKYLEDTINYFKKKGKKVYVVGTSFGAFTLIDLITNYKMNADGYFIAAGRLDMDKENWQKFSKGESSYFKYDKNGNMEVATDKLFTIAKMFGYDFNIEDKNTSKLAAGFAYNRYTKLLKNKDLSKLTYVYGTIDQAVGRLSQEEIDFLKSKNAKVVKVENGDHSKTIDYLAEKILINLK